MVAEKKAAEPGVVKKVGPVESTMVEEKKDVEMEAPPEEHEKDDKADSRPKISSPCITNDFDTTLDVFVSGEGNLLTALTAEGFQYLASGARATVGIKSGRYVFEVKGIEFHNPVDPTGRNRHPQPRHVIRIGFSKAGSQLIVGEAAGSVCFDNEGNCFLDGSKTAGRKRFAKDDVVACLLNLDSKSKNANTVSLFINGVRASEPQPLPDSLKGATLFPTVAFKNVTLATNYSSALWKPLPFKCKGVADAAKPDTEETKVVRPQSGKYEVVYPVAIPEEGFFDWCDEFLEKNPMFVELSDRKILEWCEASGLKRNNAAWMSNLDKPNFNFGVPHIDDLSCRKIINLVAATVKRHILIGECKSNLLPEERTESLKKFPAHAFKKIAKVIMGEPDAKFKKIQLELMKKHKAEVAETKRKAEENKQKAEQVRKISDHKRKKAEEKRKKAAEKKELKMAKEKAMKEAKEAADAAAKAEAEAKPGEEGEEKKSEDAEMKPAEEAKKEEAEEEEKEEEEGEDEELKELEKEIVVELKKEDVELTAEEKKMSFRTKQTEDVSSRLLASAFTKFALPDKSEGFHEVEFPWSKQKECATHLASWIKEQKICLRIEDLQPSEWFREKNEAFISERDALKKLQEDYKVKPGPLYQPEEEKPAEDAEMKPADKTAEEKPAEEAAAEGEEKPAEEEKPKEEPKKEEEPDPSTCENIKDADGKGKPLFAKWEPDDWLLLNIRFELHLLMHAFKHDVDDADRPGIPELHALFYYNKYYRRPFSTQYYGCTSIEELLTLIKGTAELKEVDKWKVLEPSQYEAAPIDTFVKLTEEARLERSRRLTAGDETVRLKINIPPPPSQNRRQNWGGGGKHGGKGYGKQDMQGGQQFNFQPGPQHGMKRTFDQGPGGYGGGGNFGKGGGKGYGKQPRWGKN